MLRTEYIILRRTPFRESSLIVSGLSPSFGRLDFLLKGALGQGTKKFPYAGLFRELSVEFKDPGAESSLLYMKSHDPLSCFDGIANYPENYIALCEYAKFLLKHIRPMLEMPDTYCALKNALKRLSGKNGNPFDLASAQLIFLQESGLVPEVPAEDAKRRSALQQILNYALNPDMMTPDFSDEYRKQLVQWIHSLCKYADEA